MTSADDTPRNVLIFGTGKGADMARRCIEIDTPHKIVGYAVDREYLEADTFHGRPVIAVDQAVAHFPPVDVFAFVPVGPARMNAVRRDKYLLLKSLGYSFISYVHSSLRIAGKNVTIGENCLILENQSVNFDVAIGNNVVMWSGCQLGDRSRIGDHCFLAAHVVINGDVEVGEACYLASNCTISHGLRLGAQSFIGANALIGQNTKDRSVHVVQPTAAIEMDSTRFVTLLRHPI